MAGLIQKVQLMLDQASQTQLVSQMRAAGQQGMAGFKQGVDAGIPGIKQTTQSLGKDFDDVGARGTKAAGGMSAAWGSFKGVMAGMGVTLGFVTLKNFIADMFQLGSGLEETASKFRTTFGPAAEAAGKFLEDFANKAGLSTQAGMDMLATIGAMTQGMGASQEAARPFSESILKLAGDFQSFHNVPIEETFAAIRSGLVGQYEPMRRFGVVLSMAEVQTRALVMTGKTHEDQLTALEKSQAALTLMYEKAGPALGDLERTQDSTANTARRLSAELTDLKIGIAERLMPAFGDLLRTVDSNREAIAGFADFLGAFLAEGLERVSGMVLSTGRDIEMFGRVFTDMGRSATIAWNTMLAAGADFVAQFLGYYAKLLEAGAKVQEMLGFGDAAAKMRATVEGIKGTIADMEEFARQKRVDADQHTLAMQENYRKYTTDTAATVKEKAVEGGEAIKGETEKGVAGAKGAIETMPGAMKAAYDSIAEETRTYWGIELPGQISDAVADAGSMWGSFSADYEKMVKESHQRAQDANLHATKLNIEEEDQARRDQRAKEIEQEMLKLQIILQSTSATEEQKRKAFEESGRLQQELDGIVARNAGEQARNAAQERIEAEQNYTGTAKELAAEREARIREEHLQHVSGITNITDEMQSGWGPQIIDIVGKLGLANSGLGEGIVKAIGLGGQFGNLVGKAASFTASIASGNWLGAIQTGIGLVGDLISAFGGLFKGSKDPERQEENERLFELARGGDAAALEKLYVMSSRGSPDGSVGWATRKMRDDAWNKYIAAGGTKNDERTSGRGLAERQATERGEPYHRGGVVGVDGGPERDVAAGTFDGVPRFHRGGLLRNERPIIGEVGEIILSNRILDRGFNSAANALAAMMAHRGGMVGGSSSLSHSFTLNGGVTINGGGAGAPQLADAFIREVDMRLGGQLGHHAAQIGRSKQ